MPFRILYFLPVLVCWDSVRADGLNILDRDRGRLMCEIDRPSVLESSVAAPWRSLRPPNCGSTCFESKHPALGGNVLDTISRSMNHRSSTGKPKISSKISKAHYEDVKQAYDRLSEIIQIYKRDLEAAKTRRGYYTYSTRYARDNKKIERTDR